MDANLLRILWLPGFSILAAMMVVPQQSSGQSNQQNLAKNANIEAVSRIGDEQADVQRMVDGDPETRWSTGSGDLALNPMDVDILWNEPHVVNSLSLLTSTLKGQLRLTDFDVFGGLHGAWDGAHPLAQVRRNAEETILVRFPAVRVDRLRIRVLGSHRPDNAFAHVAELAVYGAAGAPEREAAPSEFPPSLADAGHDPQAIGKILDELAPQAATSRVARARLDAMRNRLRLIEESHKYVAVLERISSETERYRRLGAPPWALAQRDCMARLRNWAYYWIDHQQPDGQFGGTYGDDVELTCGWPVLVLAQDDAKVRRSLELLADGVWRSEPFLEKFGYDRLTDVEHAAENTSYSQPPMVILDYANPKWAERCRRTTATMADHFLSRNQRGRLQFRSDYFGFDPKTLRPVTGERERPFDIPESSKALKPAMYALRATADQQCRQILLDYGRTWVQAVEDGGGPGRTRGLLPERILWPSGEGTGTHAWISSMRATLFHLIGCYYVSGDEQYLAPIRTLLEKSVVQWSVRDVPSAGTLGEVQDTDHVGLLDQLALVAILYRRASGDDRFDDHLARWARRIAGSLVDGVKSYVFVDRRSDGLWYVDRPLTVGAYLESRCSVGAQLYLGWLASGEEDHLAKLGWNLSSCLNDKWGAFTYWFYDKSEPRVTSNDHLAHKIQTSESALCLMYLGGPAPVESVWPQLAVAWSDTGENFCALVRRNSPRKLLAHLYGFDETDRTITANLWELAPGSYQAAVGPDADQDGQIDRDSRRTDFVVPGPSKLWKPASLHFTLPARTLTLLEIRCLEQTQ